MISASGQFEAELKKIIDAEIENIKDNMVAGSFPNVADYARHCGIVYAYRRVTEQLFHDANLKINER